MVLSVIDKCYIYYLHPEHAPCRGQTFYHFPVNPVHETSPDIGISGAYFLRIDKIPGGKHYKKKFGASKHEEFNFLHVRI